MTLSIVICTYNRYRHLERVLSALERLGYLSHFEVIIVDNSDDELGRQSFRRDVLPKYVVSYELSEPPGLSRARNVGFRVANGEVIAFLDDDAVPEEGWAEALLDTFRDADVVCAGGPISPEWETARPQWLPVELEGALTILDHGPADRDLREGEYLYGANIAFRLSVAREAGDFDERLGRQGTNLLGDEETDFQRRISQFGRRFYASRARVRHWVPAERCQFDWMLRRFAWQGVADSGSSEPWMESFVREGLSGTRLPDEYRRLVESLNRAPANSADALARLKFTRALVTALLRAPAWAANARSNGGASENTGRFTREIAAAVLDPPDLVFVEFGPAHSYLFDSFSSIPRSILLNPRWNPWSQPWACAAYLRELIQFAAESGTRTVFLLTLDYLWMEPYRVVIDEASARGVQIAGLLHRVPEEQKYIDSFRVNAPRLRAIFVFSDHVKTYLMGMAASGNVAYLPHPPVFLQEVVYAGRSCVPSSHSASDPARVCLGLLGEVRPGKRFDLVIDALTRAPLETRTRLKLLMAGSAPPEARNATLLELSRAGLVADLHWDWSPGRGYRAVPDATFADCIRRTDIMVFPYEADHSLIMSGHFVDGLAAGSLFLAASGTYLADVVCKHDLGAAFELGDAASFNAQLASLINRIDSGDRSMPQRERLLSLHSTDSICRQLREVFRVE